MSTMTAEKIDTINACFGTYPQTQALKAGQIKSDRVKLNLTEVNPVYKAFGMMVREQKFDICEMAIVSYLQGKAYGKPITLHAGDHGGALPARHHAVQFRARHGDAGHAGGPPHRRALVRPDHRLLAARHFVEGLRPRQQQGEMGDVRGRPHSRIQGPARRRARRRRQGHGQDGARRRARRRDLWHRAAARSAAEKRHPRSRRRRQGMVQEIQHGADQPHGGGQELRW